VTTKHGVGTATEVEKALAVMRWQPVQWQTMVSSGGASIRKRTLPQRQPPVIGTVIFVIVVLRHRRGGSARRW
jgi:hypothetical protein